MSEPLRPTPRVERVFRALLRLYPARFRARFDEGWRYASLAEARAARARGRAAYVYFWSATFAETIWFALQARLARVRSSDRISGAMAMNNLLLNIRFALRLMHRTPITTAAAILTLALAIGANTAIFSVAHAVMLAPLPFHEPDRLVRLVAFNPQSGITASNVSEADLLDWQARAGTFESMAGFAIFNLAVPAGDEPRRVRGAAVSPGFFDTLGTPPAAGRFFGPDDYQQGQTAPVVLGHALWMQQSGGDARTLGARWGRSNATLIGIVGSDVSYPEKVELWSPLRMNPTHARNDRYVESIARLKRGATVQQAQAELDAISKALESAYPETNRGWRVRVVPLVHFMIGDARRALFLMLAVVACVLLLASVNVAGLLLTRALARGRELALRSALGADRRRLAAQLLTEGFVLALAGSVLGLFLADRGIRVMAALAADQVPRIQSATLNLPVLGLTLATGVIVMLVIGLVPAWQASRTNVESTLRSTAVSSGSSSSHQRMHRSLVVAQIALAVILLSAAGLLLRSFDALRRTPAGFDASNVVSLRVSLSGQRYRTAETQTAYFQQAAERIASVPGVTSASAILSLPLSGGGFYLGRGWVIPGEQAPDGGYVCSFRAVLPRYFRTMGVSMLGGRDFTAADAPGSPKVAIVNRALADRFFPDGHAIGRLIYVNKGETYPREIVGVVEDVNDGSLRDEAGAQIYVPLTQSPWSDMTLVVRTAREPAALVPAIRQALRDVDRTQPPYDIRTLSDILEQATMTERLSASLTAAFGVMALLLTAVGIYGVMAFSVSRRKREMGLRLALGAHPGRVRGLVVAEGARLVVIGLAIGLAGALLTGRLLASSLYQLTPTDPLTLSVVTAVVLLTAGLATIVPAARAARVDPLSCLRSD